MNIHLKITLLTLAITLAFVAGTKSQTKPPLNDDKVALTGEVVARLQEISEKQNVPLQEVIQAVARFGLEAECLSKGGVGIVRKDVFVDTRSGTNRVMLDGNWISLGGSTSVPKLAVISKGKVIGVVDVTKEEIKDMTLILYETNSVRFFVWQEAAGGIYQRIRD